MCITELSVAYCIYGTQRERKNWKKEGEALKFLNTHPTGSEERRDEVLG